MKYYYTYKITCLEGSWKDKFYFGQHATTNLDDKYITGGKKIKCYIKKYPNGFKREILTFYNSQEDLNKAEYELIHPWLNNEMCLNLRDGGYKPTLGEEQKYKLHISVSKYMEDPEHRKNAGAKNKGKIPWNKGKETPAEVRKKQSERKQEYYKTHTSWNKNIPCSEEKKQKLSKYSPYSKGKHRVYDNLERTKYHYE